MTTVHDACRAFHGELDEIMLDITRLAAHVTEAIPIGTEALLTNGPERARAIVESSDALGRLAVDAEERCYRALALHAPVARDLRAVIAAIRLITEIQCSMRLVVDVCEAGRTLAQASPPAPVLALIGEMSEEATKLFRLSMDAYVEGDARLAAALDDLDDLLDVLHADYIEAVVTWGGAGDIGAAVQLALIGRDYERIGDHAVNIGERVRFMVDAWLPEHAGAARARTLKRVWSPAVRKADPGVATRAAG